MISYVFINGCLKTTGMKNLLQDVCIAVQDQAITINIPQNYILATPVHFLFLSKDEDNKTYNPTIKVLAGANSQFTLVEEYRGEQATNYVTNTNIEINADPNAIIHYYKIQDEDKSATHFANISIQQKDQSSVNAFFADFGSLKTTQAVHVFLSEHNAACTLQGLYYLLENQELSNQIYVEHLAPFGTSEMFYKGILNNKARAAFNGKIHVHKDASQINSKQANHNLLLSNFAEVTSKPELEIYAKDVKCTHGATIGQLDSDALFYLCARGIDKKAAKEILIRAYIADLIEKISAPLVKSLLEGRCAHVE